ncbi:ABC transporter permease [Hyphomicrobium sp. MC1]|uniref:ABC transporter permease n=1 Tax=Hyphomicrobium sp. (strain MC1) TaxID=717785 RepID=UPI000213EB8B|nr:ABC transporter permease [Hyphomicrobium sp. MC1]CCB67209.1 Spermidine/putrescine ABC transporter [Hyphomicrobium sp. MC1]
MSAGAASSKNAMWLKGYILAYVLFLYLPIAIIPIFSFNNSIQAAFPLSGFTLEWYRSLVNNENLHRAFETSLIVGFSAAFLATSIGMTVAYMEISAGDRVSRTISALARLPILIPGVIVGIALLILVNLAGLGPSRTAIVLGHTLVALPTAVVIMRSRFLSLPKSYSEVAMDLGAHEWTTFRRIILPLAAPAIASSFMLSFLTSFDEFIVAFFLSGTEPTLPLYVWGQLRFPKSLPSVMALGSVILLASVVIATAAEIIRRRGASATELPISFK